MRKIAFFVAFALGLGSCWAAPQQPATNTAVSTNAAYVQGVGPGYWPTAGSGLTLNLTAGTAFCGAAIQNYAGGTLTLAASATNYVYLNTVSNCAPASVTTGFPATAIPIATVVTSSSAITTVTDVRTWFVAPISGVVAGSCGSNTFMTAIGSSPPTCTQPSFANLSGSAAIAQLPLATPGSQGIVQLSGDLSGSAAAPQVVALQGKPVSSTTPASNQVLTWNGSQWAPAQPSFSILTGVATPSQLPGATSGAQGALQLTGDLGGSAAAPQVVSAHLASPLTPAQGGSGAGSLAAHGVLLGEGSSPFSAAGPGTTGQCLLSNGSSADPAFAACPSGGGTPGGSNTQFQYNNAGAFGGTPNLTFTSTTGVVTLNQAANGNDTFYGIRSTDASPTGNLIHFQNYAKTADLFKVDASGNVTAASFTSTASGPFVMSGTEGACSGAAAGKDVLCLGDTTTHTAQLALNGGSFLPIPQLAGDLGGTAAAPTVVSDHLSHLNQSAANGDVAGTISLAAATSASHTFSAAFNSAPICVLTPTSNPASSLRWWVTATTANVTAHTSASATIAFNYQCVGNPN